MSSNQSDLTGHLVSDCGDWTYARDFCVRTAGFPASLILRMEDEEFARPFVATENEKTHAGIAAPSGDAEEACHRYNAATARTQPVRKALAQLDRLRAAVAWQNPQALHNVLDAWTASAAVNSKQRQREDKFAAYLQRYCVKNDSIGFFGPVGWGRWGRGFTMVPGQEIVASTTVTLEHWAVNAFAQKAATMDCLLPIMVPLRKPHLWQERTEVLSAAGLFARLGKEDVEVLKQCRPDRNAQALAAIVLRNMWLPFRDAQQVYSRLKTLAKLGVLSFELPVANGDLQSFEKLRGKLRATPSQPVLSELIEELDAVENCRSQLARGDLPCTELLPLLDDLSQRFHRCTGVAPTRNAGATYAARTVVFSDCRRDLELSLSDRILESIGPAMGLVLRSAHWWCNEVAAEFMGRWQRTHQSLAVAHREVPLPLFWFHAQHDLAHDFERTLAPLVDRLQSKWRACLGPAENRSEAGTRVDSGELRRTLIPAMPIQDTVWSMAACHSPDLLLAAESLRHLEAGDYIPVLGELHVACNSTLTTALLSQNTDPERVSAAHRAIVPRGTVHLRFSPEARGNTLRTHFELDVQRDYEVLMSEGASAINPSRAALASDFVVVRKEVGLVVAKRDGSLAFPAIEFFGQLLGQQVSNRFRPFVTPDSVEPRLSIDRLVVRRATWKLGVDQLGFCARAGEAESFHAMLRLARSLRIPARLFATLPWERKPMFLSLRSPVYVRMFCRMVRSAIEQGSFETLALSEMLPDLDQLWLQDRQGQSYTSEIRMTAGHRSSQP